LLRRHFVFGLVPRYSFSRDTAAALVRRQTRTRPAHRAVTVCRPFRHLKRARHTLLATPAFLYDLPFCCVTTAFRHAVAYRLSPRASAGSAGRVTNLFYRKKLLPPTLACSPHQVLRHCYRAHCRRCAGPRFYLPHFTVVRDVRFYIFWFLRRGTPALPPYVTPAFLPLFGPPTYPPAHHCPLPTPLHTRPQCHQFSYLLVCRTIV